MVQDSRLQDLSVRMGHTIGGRLVGHRWGGATGTGAAGRWWVWDGLRVERLILFRRTTRGRVYAEPEIKPYSGATLESRAISNGLAAPVATSEAPDLSGARMERAATDRAAVAGGNPSGARVWEGGAEGGADDWYHHCLGP